MLKGGQCSQGLHLGAVRRFLERKVSATCFQFTNSVVVQEDNVQIYIVCLIVFHLGVFSILKPVAIETE